MRRRSIGVGGRVTPPHTLGELFLGFLSIGARSFGGVLPSAHYVMVEQRHWLTPEDFTETIGLCQVLPGPNIGNAAILLGKRWLGLRGAIAIVADRARHRRRRAEDARESAMAAGRRSRPGRPAALTAMIRRARCCDSAPARVTAVRFRAS